MHVFPFSQPVVDILSTGTFTLVHAVELDFKDGIVRAHTGTGEIIIDGQVYSGVGSLGSISQVQESDNSQSPVSVELTLSGLSPDIVKDTLTDRCRGRAGKLMIVAIAEDGTLAADILFSGRMDAAKFSYEKEDSSITVPLIDRMAEWDRHHIRRWTDENHQLRHPGDRFFYAIAQLSEWPIFWGSKKDAPSFDYR